MTTALLVAYYFPPLGGAGVQRALKFVRYLPEFGVTPVVVAGPTKAASRWSPEDEDLAAELPHEVAVYRPTEECILTHSPMKKLLGQWTGVEAWWAEALRAAVEKAIADHRPDVLVVTLSPFAALETVLGLGARHGIPVVADLRDPWALDEVSVYPSRWHRARAEAEMRRQLARCKRVVLNTPEALCAVVDAFPELDASRLSVITNGYDENDFSGLSPRSPDGRFRVVHSGYLHTAFAMAHDRRSATRRMLGGTACEIDFLGRSHHYLFEAVRELKERGMDLSSLDVHLLGVLSDEDRALLECSPLEPNQVRTPGYVDHGATVRAQVEADLLFLPMYALPDGRRARIVPGKTYEYLASGRPILAAVPEGDARDFVLAAEAGEVVKPNDVQGLAGALERALKRGPVPSGKRSPAVTRFERRALTAQLAQVLTEAHRLA